MRIASCLGALLAAAVLAAAVRPGAQAGPPPFIDITASSGLDFVHANGATGRLLLPEVIGSGGALFDYDNDGDLDLLAVQSGPVPPAKPGTGSRLYRNDGRPGATPRFTDVTRESRIAFSGYGMGAAAGDVDNDGDVDLFVTALDASALFRNDGDGTFTDVTKEAGAGDPRWSTSASFFDYDADGWLDLFVANYVDFRHDMKRECFAASSARDYCNPAAYAPVPARLLRNTGHGTFTDVSRESGVARSAGRGLGVLAADVNDDGWTDVYVANDGDPNHLWINQQGSGAFRDQGLLSGVAVSRAGRPQGSMGIEFADVDGDGDGDLFVTNLDNEGNTLYANQGKGLFEDRTIEAGLFGLGFTGFGTRFLDYDADGWLDLVVANGAVRHQAAQVRQGDPYPLRQRNQLFRNSRRGVFTNVTDRAGDAFAPPGVGRGVASGDIDNDGDVDVVIFHNSGAARVLLNASQPGRHWIGLRVLTSTGRDAVGAHVSIGTTTRRVQADGSYLASSDPRVVFGLGADAAPKTVRVRWGDGRTEEFRGLAIDRYWALEPGRAPRAP